VGCLRMAGIGMGNGVVDGRRPMPSLLEDLELQRNVRGARATREYLIPGSSRRTLQHHTTPHHTTLHHTHPDSLGDLIPWLLIHTHSALSVYLLQ
jgi:hypothetical protein